MEKEMAILPEDVLTEILVKFSVKSLLRFMCVCKSWSHLIKSPNFINMHLKHQSSTKNNDCILIKRGLSATQRIFSFHSYETLGVISPHLELPYFQTRCAISWPCNGLLCLANSTDIYLCNPALREFKLLPPGPCPDGLEIDVFHIGLGYDSKSHNYKVVAFVKCKRKSGDIVTYELRIYNLSTNSWKQIDHDSLTFCYPLVHGVSCNGVLHWVAYPRVDGGSNVISTLDISSEVSQVMEIPNALTTEYERLKYLNLTVLNDSLALFAFMPYYLNPEEQFVDIWVMKEYNVVKSWTKQVTIGPLTRLHDPHLLWKNEAILIELQYHVLASCTLDTSEIIDFEIRDYIDSLGLIVYKESLISIH